ncbi:MAG TPA: hypothetical protein VH796_12010 [Nitrososphaeraceae archaeon]|jgi:hypothetical protein
MAVNYIVKSFFFIILSLIVIFLINIPIRQQIEALPTALTQKDRTNINNIISEVAKNATAAIQNKTLQATNPCALPSSDTSIAIDSKKTLITPQDVFLNIFVYDMNNCSVNKQVNIQVRYLGDKDEADSNLKTITNNYNNDKPSIITKASASSEQQNLATIKTMPLIYNETALISFFSKSGIPLDKQGLYLVRASIPGEDQVKPSWIVIHGRDLFGTNFALSLIIGFIAFIGLLIFSIFANIYGNKLQKYSKEVRFLCISVMVFSMAVVFYFVTEELGTGSPLGLIKRPLTNSSITSLIPGASGEQWVINIGGVPENKYMFGLQIPVYVFVFGLVGGYIRYLYATVQSQTDNGGKVTVYNSLYDVAQIFLAPLLAAAVWFLIIQNGVDPLKGIFMLAVISFAVGLATTNVVNALITFLNMNMRSRNTQASTQSASK